MSHTPASPTSVRSGILPKICWILFFVVAFLYPLIPGLDDRVFQITQQPVGGRLTSIFVYAILALGLNVVVGNAGLLQLGIGAFFGFGAYITGILTVEEYPFQMNFFVCVAASVLGSAFLSVLLSAPVLRLRGDYFALVTLGFGEVVRFTLRNLEEVTAGTKGLKPIPSPEIVPFDLFAINWSNYRSYYLLALTMLLVIVVLLRNLERSAVGRAWVSLREDELAAASMGLNVARLKLGAIALALAWRAWRVACLRLSFAIHPIRINTALTFPSLRFVA